MVVELGELQCTLQEDEGAICGDMGAIDIICKAEERTGEDREVSHAGSCKARQGKRAGRGSCGNRRQLGCGCKPAGRSCSPSPTQVQGMLVS